MAAAAVFNLHPVLRVVEAASLFKPPGRDSRPDRFVVLLRGVPGSGKSHAAGRIRELEAKHASGGATSRSTRVISIDDYYLVEDDESGEMAYEWEEGMEEAYRASAVKQLKKALETPRTSAGFQPVLVVDEPNLLLSHLMAYVQVARAAATPVYVAELRGEGAEPATCAARNVHGWSPAQVEEMAGKYEATPPELPTLKLGSLESDDSEGGGAAGAAGVAADGAGGSGAGPVDAAADAEVGGATASASSSNGGVKAAGAEQSSQASGGQPSDAEYSYTFGGRRLRSPPPPAAASKWNVDDDDEEDKEEDEDATAAEAVRAAARGLGAM